jgi:hypothetical protein
LKTEERLILGEITNKLKLSPDKEDIREHEEEKTTQVDYSLSEEKIGTMKQKA